MPTLDASWTGRLRTIGDLERPDHYHLTKDDECAFFGEYTSGKSWAHSSTNQVIYNLKKKPSRARGTPQWMHKVRTIGDLGAAIRRCVVPEALSTTLFVPIPSSKGPTHEDYDPRMMQVAHQIGAPARAMELISNVCDRDAFHENANTRDPEELKQQLNVSSAQIPDDVERIILLDDMVTTGCSFRACKDLLLDQYPGRSVYGLFVSRRVIPNPFTEWIEE